MSAPVTIDIQHNTASFRFFFDSPDAIPAVKRYVPPRGRACQYWRAVNFTSVPFVACAAAREQALAQFANR